MPQVDLESLVCGVSGAGAGDRKVSCETVIAGGSEDASPPRMPQPPPPPPPPPDPDFPPESITIPIGDDVAFSELNPIYERDDSTKGSTNPKFAAAVVANPIAAKTRSNSTRVAGAPPPPGAGTTFFGLPAKIRPTFSRRRPSQGRILHDKRAGGGEVEPRSPKVSCIGKVLSDRERHGRRRRGRRGWWQGVAAMFRCDGCGRVPGGASRKTALEDDDGEQQQQQQPGIAGMQRFKSGRRAASWVDEALAAAAAAGDEDEGKEKERPDSQDAEQWSRRPVI